MDNCNIINIGLRVIKHCGIYAKEYKNWILHKNTVPPIVETIDSFKEYWANVIALVNQTTVLALQHGYGITAVDNNALLALYGDPLANFGAAYAATQETMKSQADSLVAIQGQLANIQQFCMRGPLANSPQAVSMPPLSSNARATIATYTMVVVKAAAKVFRNKQP
jgi:hypothetical protein